MEENDTPPVVSTKVRTFENFHILLWLLKDLCWVADFKLMGTIMIVPTVLVAIYITIITRKNQSELFHNLAVVCWIMANSVWMLGEFLLTTPRGLTLPDFSSSDCCLSLIFMVTAS